ncbi:MAG: YfiR family protein [Burkholderiales bacterium]|nr:YfiR family protein [Burkholderiales bacterium]
MSLPLHPAGSASITVRLLRCGLLLLLAVLAALPCARADDLPEYRLKAAFVYHFISYTDWPAETAATLNLCLVGGDPFGGEIDGLRGKPVGSRSIEIRRPGAGAELLGCQAVFVAPSAIERLPHLLEALHGHAVLTIADSPGAMRAGVMINMVLVDGRVKFEANLRAARGAGLNLSSRLLHLATEVVQ